MDTELSTLSRVSKEVTRFQIPPLRIQILCSFRSLAVIYWTFDSTWNSQAAMLHIASRYIFFSKCR